MRPPHTLSAYVAREVASYTALGLAAITVVLVGRNLFRHLGELVSAGASATDVFGVLANLAAMLAAYALPIAFLFGVLVATSRLASDRETLALDSCGVGPRALLLPVVALGLLVSCTTAYLVGEVEHRARRSLRLHVRTLAAEGRLLQPGSFREVGERVIFVRQREARDRYLGVVIADHADPARPLWIFAERGELAWEDGGGALRLRLFDGDVHVDATRGTSADDARYRRIAFERFDYRIAAAELLGAEVASYRPREMDRSQLRAVIARAAAGESLADLRRKDAVYYDLQLTRRAALPAAPLLFGLLGVPLGLRPRRGGRARAVLLCVALVLGYYALLSFGQAAAVARLLPPVPALWLPNAALALAAAVLLPRALRGGAPA